MYYSCLGLLTSKLVQLIRSPLQNSLTPIPDDLFRSKEYSTSYNPFDIWSRFFLPQLQKLPRLFSQNAQANCMGGRVVNVKRRFVPLIFAAYIDQRGMWKLQKIENQIRKGRR